jgi:hypothetical protein
MNNPRTLILSLRNIFRNDLFRCPLYEFEDIITEIDHADMIAPKGDPTSRRNQLAIRLAFHAPIALKAKIQQMAVDKQYELLLAICGHPRDLLLIDSAIRLKSIRATKVCLVDELWVKQMDGHRHFVDILKNFDLVVLYYSESVRALSERIGRNCVFVPPGIDCIRFCPYPSDLKRVVDVYSVGRRSETTHRAILKMAAEQGIFYLHDTVRGTEAIDPRQHRDLFANTAKRAKYFIVNPGLIDLPDRRGTQSEMGNRYFEGASAGMIMIGETPTNGEFEKLFGWSGAVIHLPYDSEEIASTINRLEMQPERLEQIRRMNVVQALRRHDWVYRWEAILQNAGLEPMPGLSQRKERLETIAESICASMNFCRLREDA